MASSAEQAVPHLSTSTALRRTPPFDLDLIASEVGGQSRFTGDRECAGGVAAARRRSIRRDPRSGHGRSMPVSGPRRRGDAAGYQLAAPVAARLPSRNGRLGGVPPGGNAPAGVPRLAVSREHRRLGDGALHRRYGRLGGDAIGRNRGVVASALCRSGNSCASRSSLFTVVAGRSSRAAGRCAPLPIRSARHRRREQSSSVAA